MAANSEITTVYITMEGSRSWLCQLRTYFESFVENSSSETLLDMVSLYLNCFYIIMSWSIFDLTDCTSSDLRLKICVLSLILYVKFCWCSFLERSICSKSRTDSSNSRKKSNSTRQSVIYFKKKEGNQEIFG